MNLTPNKKLSLRAVLAPFPVLLIQLATPLVPSHPKQSRILPKIGGNEWVFFTPTLLGRVGAGDDGMNPKPDKKWSLGAGFYQTITWKGFFTQPQVLLSFIAVPTS